VAEQSEPPKSDEIQNPPATGPEFQAKLMQDLLTQGDNSTKPEFVYYKGQKVKVRDDRQELRRIITPKGLTSLFPGLRTPKQRLVGVAKKARFG
jgi:hypothetical protein